MTYFIAIFALLQWSEPEPTLSLRYACISPLPLNGSFAYSDVMKDPVLIKQTF